MYALPDKGYKLGRRCIGASKTVQHTLGYEVGGEERTFQWVSDHYLWYVHSYVLPQKYFAVLVSDLAQSADKRRPIKTSSAKYFLRK